jgi:RNA polymerase sigma-70 factor (ECF subfamily)
LLGNPSAAEDAVQDSFLRVWRQADKWRPTGTVSAWLHRIAHYICIDRLRVACPDESTEGLEVPDLRDGPEATHQQAEVGDHLNGGINRLPARQKSALLLVHFQELRGREASEILDISVEALESLLTRARRNLRDYLAHEKDALIGGSEP